MQCFLVESYNRKKTLLRSKATKNKFDHCLNALSLAVAEIFWLDKTGKTKRDHKIMRRI